MQEIFDGWRSINIELYEECFEIFDDVIQNPDQYSNQDLFDLLTNDPVFERFIYIYTTVTFGLGDKDYMFFGEDFSPSLFNYQFADLLIQGAIKKNNIFGYLIYQLQDFCEEGNCNYFTDKINDEFYLIKKNKFYQLADVYFSNMSGLNQSTLEKNTKFYEKYSINEFPENYHKLIHTFTKTYYLVDIKSKSPEKDLISAMNLLLNFSGDRWSSIDIHFREALVFTYVRTNRNSLARRTLKEMFSALGIEYNSFIKNFELPQHFKQNNDFFDYFGLTILDSLLLISNESLDYKWFDNAIEKTHEFRTINNDGFSNYGLARKYIYFADYKSAYQIFRFDNADRDTRYIEPYGSLNYNVKNHVHDSVGIVHYIHASLAASGSDNIEDAIYALENAKDALDANPINEPFLELLLDLAELKMKLRKKDFEKSKEIFNFLTKKINDHGTDFGYFLDEDINYFIYEYLSIFRLLQKKVNGLADPLHIYDLKEKVYFELKFSSLKFNKDQTELNLLVENYQKTKLDLLLLDDEILLAKDTEDLEMLMERSSSLDKSLNNIRANIFEKKANLLNYYQNNSSTIPEVQNRINDDEHVIFYSFSLNQSLALKVSKNDYKFIDISKTDFEIHQLISDLNKGLNIQDNTLAYDYFSSNTLFESIFLPLSINQSDSVYIYNNDIVNNLSFSVLATDNPIESNDWKKLTKTIWLGDLNPIAKLLSLKTDKSLNEYKKSFVGFGNPIISTEVTLDSLPVTKTELINMAIASNGSPNDVYLSEKATIENFKSEIKANPEILVLGTHGFGANKIDGV
ncbi:MAG: hypothetical protein ISQ46_05205, partial [Methylophilaceae bacterium]|nr:hypothetical protein [Methylophilaceae bacterium]